MVTVLMPPAVPVGDPPINISPKDTIEEALERFSCGIVANPAVRVVIDWKKETIYDRMGLEEQYIEYLGNKVTCYHLPVRPGRNLAVIVECAAVNHRQKKMGYNAAQELYKRVQQSLIHDPEEDNGDGWI